jgi:hypothetical protein
MASIISSISQGTSSFTEIKQPELCDCYLNQKIRELYQKHVVENRYFNLVFYNFLKGMGFAMGAIISIFFAKDLIIEIFRTQIKQRE